MADDPSSKQNDSNSPSPELLVPKEETSADAPEGSDAAAKDGAKDNKDVKPVLRKRGSYRAGHKATLLGVIVVLVILAVNGGVIYFVIKKQTGEQVKQLTQGQVTINEGVLDKLGVNRDSIGDEGVQLTINPNTKFGGNVEISKDLALAGKLTLNGDFTAPNASFAKLQGGDTALAKLNVNGDTTVSNLNVRQEMVVTGTTRLQGPTIITQLLTANNINVAANLAIGGVLSANSFHTSSLRVDSILTLGGHIVTTGSPPSITAGNALGSSGTVSVSGSDAAGTVAANLGLGATAGTIGTVTFRTPYTSTPRVVITAVGSPFGNVYINRTARGFSIHVTSAAPPGGYAFDYIVMQ